LPKKGNIDFGVSGIPYHLQLERRFPENPHMCGFIRTNPHFLSLMCGLATLWRPAGRIIRPHCGKPGGIASLFRDLHGPIQPDGPLRHRTCARAQPTAPPL